MKNIFLLVAISIFSFTACDDDDHDPRFDRDLEDLEINIKNLSDLGDDYVYEGWVIVNGSPVSTGTFTVNENGKQSETEFFVEETVLESASSFVLSIEPSVDTDPAPSDIKILSGSFFDETAQVTVKELVGDFSNISGGFIIATPTGTENTDNGIWFLDNGSPSLTLPTLAEGWIYEGWVVFDGIPVSTGTFSSVTGQDNSALFSGPGGPDFPGEDFLFDAPDGVTFGEGLGGKTVVISIEPDPDNETAPFQFKPLVGTVSDSPALGTLMPLEDKSSTLPYGTVSF